MNDKKVILGFDPGRLKCGIAVMGVDQQLFLHEVVASEAAIATLDSLCQQFSIDRLVMGDQTTSRTWKKQIIEGLSTPMEIEMVDERYSSLEARDRYWELYPPKGLMRLVPLGMREPPRPIDDIVAIILIERYLAKLRELRVDG